MTIKTNEAHYGYFLRKYDKCPAKAVGWASQSDQVKRFDILTEGMDGTRLDVLDVGCGCADLNVFLDEHYELAQVIEYTGIDGVQEMIRRASKALVNDKGRERYGVVKLCNLRDYKSKHDYVVSSGAFNLKVSEKRYEQYGYLRKCIQKMFLLFKRQVSFNLLRYRVSNEEENSELFYYKPATVIALLEDMRLNYSIRADYMFNDFTVFIKK